MNGWQAKGLVITWQHVQNVNKDVDFFKVRVSDMPLHVSSLHEAGLMLGPPRWGIMVAWKASATKVG